MKAKRELRLLFSMLSIISFVVLSSCAHQYYPATQEKPTRQEISNVTYQDLNLKVYLKVIKVAAEIAPSGLMKVKALIRNDARQDIWADVQVIFKSADGFEVESTNWQPVYFAKGKDVTYQQQSLSNKATDFNILLRKPKKSK